MHCEGCGTEQNVSIAIEVAETLGRFYIPNQIARRERINIKELWFCSPCMRFLEDNFRAGIAYLKAEKGLKFKT